MHRGLQRTISILTTCVLAVGLHGCAVDDTTGTTTSLADDAGWPTTDTSPNTSPNNSPNNSPNAPNSASPDTPTPPMDADPTADVRPPTDAPPDVPTPDLDAGDNDDVEDAWPSAQASFTDDASNEFGLSSGAVASGVRVVDGRLTTQDDVNEGVFTSRVMDAQSAMTWRTLTWSPELPYGRAMPANGGSNNGFPGGDVSMSQNVLLLPLDGTNGRLDSALTDLSGEGIESGAFGGGIDPAAGVFDGALDLGAPDHLRVDGGHGEFNFGTGDFSWSVWVKTTTGCAQNNVVLGMNYTGSRPTHMWMGGACSVCGGNNVGVFLLRDSANVRIDVCGDRPINDGSWHHLVGVKRGHNPATVLLWVDGEASGGTERFTGAFDFAPEHELYVGNFPGESYPTAVTVDELAVWRRALDDDEVLALYGRAARLELTVQVCQDVACADATPFVGPTEEGVFTPSANAPSVIALPVTLPAGRYFRYRLTFERLGGTQPYLASTSVEARR